MKKVWIISAGLGIVLIAFILLGQLTAPSSPLERPYKIGVLIANDLRLVKVEALKLRLEELGLVEGEDVVYQIENARNDLDQLVGLGEKLLSDKPDVLVASGAVEALRLKELTADQLSPTPVVFMGTLSPSVIGLVEDTVRPGDNLTGLNNYHYELTPKRLELLHRLLPGIRKVAVLGDSRVPFFGQTQEGLLQAANKMGLELHTYTVTNTGGIPVVFEAIQGAQEEGIVLLPGFFLESYTEQIVQCALDLKIPVFGVYPQDTVDGCLASYGTSNRDQGAQSANIVYKVLQGQNPQVLPVETPDQIIFSVNLATAKKLGITPSQAVLSLADEVVQNE